MSNAIISLVSIKRSLIHKNKIIFCISGKFLILFLGPGSIDGMTNTKCGNKTRTKIINGQETGVSLLKKLFFKVREKYKYFFLTNCV